MLAADAFEIFHHELTTLVMEPNRGQLEGVQGEVDFLAAICRDKRRSAEDRTQAMTALVYLANLCDDAYDFLHDIGFEDDKAVPREAVQALRR